MKTAVRIALWTALSFGGALVISVATSHSSPGSSAGMGWFSYKFQCSLAPESVYDGQEKPVVGVIRIKGTAPSRFRFDGSVSPHYGKVTMEWILYSGGALRSTGGQADVNLLANVIQTSGDSVPLDSSGLASVIGIDDSPPNKLFVNALLEFLGDCRSGDLPRPRHHTIRFDDTIGGQMQHFAAGSFLPYPLIIWFAASAVFIFSIYQAQWLTSRRWRRRGSRLIKLGVDPGAPFL